MPEDVWSRGAPTRTALRPRLLMLPSAPVIERAGGMLVLDTKFVEGMKMHRDYWPGDVACILRRSADHIPFGADFRADALGFDLQIIEVGTTLTAERLDSYDIVLCAGDMHTDLGVVDLVARGGPKIVYAIEYTLGTRLRIAMLDESRALARKTYSILWTLRQEARRRRAFRHSDGLQANGYPAFEAYKGLSRDPMLYLDNRMKPELFASESEMAARFDRQLAAKPLRLVNSGRLEPMKGAQDIAPVARRLRDMGLDFRLDIYGSGSLRSTIAAQIDAWHLHDRVILHDPVDFETELIPILRQRADIFLSCHRQADPSCSYLESMGCGLAVVGYDNRMLSTLLSQSGAGWTARLGDVAGLARKVAAIDSDRESVAQKCKNALAFAKCHDFASQFRARMDQLVSLVQSNC